MHGGRGVSEAMKISWRPLRWGLGLPPQAGIRDSHLYIPLIKRPQLNYTFNYTSTKVDLPGSARFELNGTLPPRPGSQKRYFNYPSVLE